MQEMQKRGSAKDRGMTVQAKGSCCARDRGVLVKETEEGQCKRQGICSARDRGVVVQETGQL